MASEETPAPSLLGHLRAVLPGPLVPKVTPMALSQRPHGVLSSSPDPKTLSNTSKMKDGLNYRLF